MGYPIATAAMDQCDIFRQKPTNKGVKGGKIKKEPVTIMHYLMPDGRFIVNFEHASTVLDILTAFIEAVVDQPHLHAMYLCLHPKLQSDYFDRALLLEDLVAVSMSPLFGHVLNHLKAWCHLHTRHVLFIFTYLIFCCLVPQTIS
jgi:hypothetical protein